ncbi:hypothetical protein ACIO3O_26410 [Streptomyces sp. NPDC087440]|uniref:hypothetical protein n=1 Tax=Streptomyces sp. NPDC087440 TaxID=3365790 RepID=UPI0038093F84
MSAGHPATTPESPDPALQQLLTDLLTRNSDSPLPWEDRSPVTGAVLADRTGPLALRLLAAVHDGLPLVRRRAVELLDSLAYAHTHADRGLDARSPWPEAVAAVRSVLDEPDPATRWTAAWLYVRTAGLDAALAELHARSRPAPARLTLAQACLQYVRLYVTEVTRPVAEATVLRLRADPEQAVQVCAHLAALHVLPGSRYDEASRALRRELPVLDGALAATVGTWSFGQVWAQAHDRRNRPRDCFRQAAQLLAAPDPYRRRVGLDMARVAVEEWRAGGRRLREPLVGLLDDPELGTEALELVASSRVASRRACEYLADLAHPAEGADPSLHAAVALGVIGDIRAVAPLCAALAAGDYRGQSRGRVEQAFAGLAASATAALVEGLRGVLEQGRATAVAHRVRRLGAAAAPLVPQLTEALARELGDDGSPVRAGQLVRGLAAIGPAAAQALPLVAAMPEPPPLALLLIGGERGPAEARLAALPEAPRRLKEAARLFGGLLAHGGLSARQAAQLHTLTFRRYGTDQAECAAVWWRYAGESAAPALLEVLPGYLRDVGLLGVPALECLGDMGPHAAPALPAIDAFLAHERRAIRHRGDETSDMQADEVVQDAARRARGRIGRSG